MWPFKKVTPDEKVEIVKERKFITFEEGSFDDLKNKKSNIRKSAKSITLLSIIKEMFKK